MIKCPICNKKFKQLTKSHLDTHNITIDEFKNKFPNISLSNKNTIDYYKKIKKNNIEKYYNQPNRCIQCNKILSYEQRHNKFCSQSCATSYNNRRHIKRHGKEKFCINCGISLKGKSAKKFCSLKCQHEYYWKLRVKKIDETGIIHGKNITNLYMAKKYLIEKRGHKCEICGLTEWMGKPIPLIFDHIDGNSENGKIENCRLVCGNCDMQLPTYKGKNLGKGRYWRKKRYQKGKSY